MLLAVVMNMKADDNRPLNNKMDSQAAELNQKAPAGLWTRGDKVHYRRHEVTWTGLAKSAG
ncbi:hypothetical protein BaRGS_00019604, partial [Batillaria attramentaria]